MDVAGKTAIVTGSAVGVGRAIALELARRKANVVVNYSRSETDARRTLADVKALGAKALLVKADVSSDTQVRDMVAQAVERFKSVDILVNNAAITYFVDFHDLDGLSDAMWDRIFEVNVKGVWYCSRAVVPFMRQAGQGSIVNIASVAGVQGAGSSIAYCASKAAVINMTLAFARAFAPEIRVNSVSPGFIDTRWHLSRKEAADYEGFKERMAQITPLRRVCSPENVAQVAMALIESADMATGQNIVVDGGIVIHI